MRATSSRPSRSRSATAGVKSEKPPVHLGKPATGWPVRPSQAWSAAESGARMAAGTPEPETSARAAALGERGVGELPRRAGAEVDQVLPEQVDRHDRDRPRRQVVDDGRGEALGDEVLRGAVALHEALERDRPTLDEAGVAARRALAV